MEEQLFSWDEVDVIDDGVYTFFNVILKKQIDEFPEGTIFKYANIDYQKGTLEFWDVEGKIKAKFALELKLIKVA